MAEAEYLGSLGGNIDDPPFDEGATVIDGENQLMAVPKIRHLHLGSKREKTMRAAHTCARPIVRRPPLPRRRIGKGGGKDKCG